MSECFTAYALAMGVLGDQELVLNFWYTYDAERVNWQVDAASPVFVFVFFFEGLWSCHFVFPIECSFPSVY